MWGWFSLVSCPFFRLGSWYSQVDSYCWLLCLHSLPFSPTTLCSGVWFMWIAPISSSGWVQSMVCPDRRLEEEDIYSWVQIFIPLASSLRRCFKVVCFSQPKVLGSHGGLLIINFPFLVPKTTPLSHFIGFRSASGSAVISAGYGAIPYSFPTTPPHIPVNSLLQLPQMTEYNTCLILDSMLDYLVLG